MPMTGLIDVPRKAWPVRIVRRPMCSAGAASPGFSATGVVTVIALTGSPLAGLKCREAWADYARAMIDGCSLRTAARRSGVHLSTAFRWRHRLLQGPAQEQDTELHNIVEADETYFLESQKGRRQGLSRAPRKRGGKASKRGLSEEQTAVLICRDRTGNTADFILEKADKAHLGAVLKPLLATDVILCTD